MYQGSYQTCWAPTMLNAISCLAFLGGIVPLGSTVAQICSVNGTSQAESVREAWTAHAGCVSSAAWPVKLDVMDHSVSLYDCLCQQH